MAPWRAGLALAAIGCLCAFGVGSASATTLHECEEAPGTSGNYLSNQCEGTVASAPFHWVPINSASAMLPRDLASLNFNGTLAEVKFGIKCNTIKGTGSAESVKGEVRGFGIAWSLSNCAVTEPTGKGCTIPSEISLATLKSITSMVGETTTIKTAYTPASGTRIMTLKVSGCSISAMNGEKSVNGTLASVTVAKTPARQEFTAASGSELEIAAAPVGATGAIENSTPNGDALSLMNP
jgi:hypothetical protein